MTRLVFMSDEIVRLYGEMKSMKGLARRLGIHHHTVRKHLIGRGVEIEQPKQMSDDQLALATHLYVDEQLTAEFVKPNAAADRSITTVRAVLDRLDLPVRDISGILSVLTRSDRSRLSH